LKQKYIPLEKRSKREQKAYFSARRGSWGEINPVTKKPSNPKAYSRKKSVKWYDHEPFDGFSLSVHVLRSMRKRPPSDVWYTSNLALACTSTLNPTKKK